MNHEDLVFATVMLPLLGAAFALFGKLTKRSTLTSWWNGVGSFVGLALPWVPLILLAPVVLQGQSIEGVVGNWYEQIGVAYTYDGLAWLIQILGYTIGGAAWIYALGGGPKGNTFTAIFLIQTGALAATILTTDIFNLFVCLEVLGITSYVLLPTSKKPGASLASFSYLMVSATAMVLFLLGTYALYRITGSLAYDQIAQGLIGLDGHQHIVSLMALVLIVSAIAIRVAVMPLYGWLPDAHALAPHAVSAVLSGVLIKTPLFALTRVLHVFPSGSEVGSLISIAGALTAVIAVIIALSQEDVKQLLAYHSISQIGYITAAWGAAISIGTTDTTGVALMVGAYLHALFHALFKGLLFLSVGTTVDVCGNRNVYTLRRGAKALRSAGERFPITIITCIIGALAISAIAPLNGSVSKQIITSAMKGSVHYYLLSAAAVGTIASFIKLLRIFFGGSSEGEEIRIRVRHLRSRWIAQTILALLCILTGICAPQVVSYTARILFPQASSAMLFTYSFSADLMVKTGITVALGVLVYLMMHLRVVKHLLTLIRTRYRDFTGLFVSFSLATAVLALFLIL